ncbi:hypothetical protein SG82_19445 [Enterobacter hormaechei subsp. xiangfangensis]|nr:hypothetical protein SG82_19445 [Enterobacter hormaechei subsp. xiangfangensis]
MTRYQKKPTEVVGCITKYTKAVLSVFCAIIFQNLMKLTQINYDAMPKAKARKLMMRPTVKHWKLKGSAGLKYTASKCNHTKQMCIVQYTD